MVEDSDSLMDKPVTCEMLSPDFQKYLAGLKKNTTMPGEQEEEFISKCRKIFGNDFEGLHLRDDGGVNVNITQPIEGTHHFHSVQIYTAWYKHSDGLFYDHKEKKDQDQQSTSPIQVTISSYYEWLLLLEKVLAESDMTASDFQEGLDTIKGSSFHYPEDYHKAGFSPERAVQDYFSRLLERKKDG